MTEKYFIVDIIQSVDSRYGDIAIIRANPVKVTPSGYMSASESLVGAEHFFLPLNDTLIQSIIAEQRQNQYWKVNFDDFEEEYIFDESDNCRRLIHRHVSFYYMDVDSDDSDEYIEIPDIDKKSEYIRRAWAQSDRHAHSSLREYIVDRATEGFIGQFWAWLLDDVSLSCLVPEDILDMEDKYTNALAEFIGFCEDPESF